MELMLAALRGRQSRKMSNNEIPADKLAAFLDGRLSEEERARIEAVLADDPAARAEFIATFRLVAEVDRPVEASRTSWKPWVMFAGVAAAATIALAIIPDARNPEAPVSAERIAPNDAGDGIVLLAPSEGRAVRSSDVTFRWSAPDSATFRITVADETGQTLWTALTPGTDIVLPDSVVLLPGRRHFWYIDAVYQDGSSVTSGPRAFTTASN
jgi:hypothetical protein